MAVDGYEVRREMDRATGRWGIWIGPTPGGRLTPELLMAAAREATAWVREMSADEWHRITGRDIRNELQSVWTGRVTDVYLATLAWAYSEIAPLSFVKVVPTLAEMLGRSPNTIKMHLVRARDRGFLTGEVGKAAGELTPAARAVLDKHLADTHPYG